MKGIDTNVIIRFLVRDDEEQAQAVRNLFLDAEKNHETFFVPVAVTLEVIWVLSSAYKFTKNEIIEALENLLAFRILSFEEHDRIYQLCSIGISHDADLADLLIGLSARDHGCATIITFDKKAARSDMFSLIG